MRPRSTIVTIALTAGLALSLPGTASAADVDCAAFPSRAAAQAALEADRTDPDDLDTDEDGKACETYDYSARGSTTQVVTVPAGAVAAGDGSAADDGPGLLPVVLGGLAVAAAGGAVLARRGTA